MTKRLELRRKGKHFTVVDSTGRVYAREKNATDAHRAWRRAMKGLSRELGERVGPRQFPDQPQRR